MLPAIPDMTQAEIVMPSQTTFCPCGGSFGPEFCDIILFVMKLSRDIENYTLSADEKFTNIFGLRIILQRLFRPLRIGAVASPRFEVFGAVVIAMVLLGGTQTLHREQWYMRLAALRYRVCRGVGNLGSRGDGYVPKKTTRPCAKNGSFGGCHHR
jgi:hypothetical protein